MARAAQCVSVGLVLAAAGVLLVEAQTLTVTEAGGRVRIAAPGLRFLTGKALERLRNGNTVTFDIQLTALGEGRTTVLQRAVERFAISYDLWEQSYSVSRMRTARASAAHLSAEAAEAWCLDMMTLPVSTLPAGQPIWFRLEVRANDPRVRDGVFDEPGLSLSGLVDVFSRIGGRGTQTWKAEAGPVTRKRP